MMLHWLAGYTHRFTAAERISVPHGVTFTAAGLASDAQPLPAAATLAGRRSSCLRHR